MPPKPILQYPTQHNIACSLPAVACSAQLKIFEGIQEFSAYISHRSRTLLLDFVCCSCACHSLLFEPAASVFDDFRGTYAVLGSSMTTCIHQ